MCLVYVWKCFVSFGHCHRNENGKNFKYLGQDVHLKGRQTITKSSSDKSSIIFLVLCSKLPTVSYHLLDRRNGLGLSLSHIFWSLVRIPISEIAQNSRENNKT